MAARGLHARLGIVYENSMAGALRIRARDGAGIAWLPKSLVAPDMENGQLALAGDATLEIELQIRLYRVAGDGNSLTHAIWDYLRGREPLRVRPSTE